jgi:hypothetical protein
VLFCAQLDELQLRYVDTSVPADGDFNLFRLRSLQLQSLDVRVKERDQSAAAGPLFTFAGTTLRSLSITLAATIQHDLEDFRALICLILDFSYSYSCGTLPATIMRNLDPANLCQLSVLRFVGICLDDWHDMDMLCSLLLKVPSPHLHEVRVAIRRATRRDYNVNAVDWSTLDALLSGTRHAAFSSLIIGYEQTRRPYYTTCLEPDELAKDIRQRLPLLRDAGKLAFVDWHDI